MISNIDNSAETIKLRKSRDTLIIVGRGVILFGLWSAVKLYSLAFLRTSQTIKEIRETMPADAEPISNRLMIILLLVMITVVVIAEISIRFFVGYSAIAEARGKRSGRLYIPITYIYIMASFFTFIAIIAAMITGKASEETTEDVSLASAVIEFTNMIMLIQMVISARRVKKHRKRKRREEAGLAA